MRRGTNLVRLGDFNQSVVLDAVRQHDQGISRAELGRLTGLSSQTVSNIARRLIADGLLREGAPVPLARGKPRTPLLIDPTGGYAIGVHVDPARLTFVLTDLTGRVQAFNRTPTPGSRTGPGVPGQVVEAIAQAVDRLRTRAGVDPARLLGVGVAAPGPIDVERGVLIDPPQLSGWHDVALRTDLSAATGLPVLLDKDVTAAATAELRAGRSAGTGTRADLVFLYLGSGVGAGVVLGDEVQRGASNNIGEVGQLLVDPDAEPLGWGRRGSLATACLPQALVEQADRLGILDAPPHDDFVANDAAVTRLCELAYAGPGAAADLIDRSAARVATALAVLVNLLDVDRVVLGGPLWSRLSSRYLALLPGLIEPQLVARRRTLVVEGSAVGEDVAAQGAAALVLDHRLAPSPSTLLLV